MSPQRKKKPPEELKEYNQWTDESAPGEVFDHDKFMVRLKEVHGIDPKTIRGTKKMIVHLDGDTWFASTYEWEIGGKKFTQNTRNNRRGMNRRIWTNGKEM